MGTPIQVVGPEILSTLPQGLREWGWKARRGQWPQPNDQTTKTTARPPGRNQKTKDKRRKTKGKSCQESTKRRDSDTKTPSKDHEEEKMEKNESGASSKKERCWMIVVQRDNGTEGKGKGNDAGGLLI